MASVDRIISAVLEQSAEEKDDEELGVGGFCRVLKLKFNLITSLKFTYTL